jgi:hypothetical protein
MHRRLISVLLVFAALVAPARAQDLRITVVDPGGDLQAALNTGGRITLRAGATYAAPKFTFRSNTILTGNGAEILGTSGPALYVPPGVHDVSIIDVSATSSNQSVVQLGDNGAATQGSLDRVPQRIVLDRVRVSSHHGTHAKRAFEINAQHVTLTNCEAHDVWSADVDTQAIVILNTPGHVLIEGGAFAAGTQPFMAGGDTMKIPGVQMADITLRNTRLYRPLSWRSDGVARRVKNLFELKAGVRVKVENVLMEGNWVDAQSNGALVLTPRNGQSVEVEFVGLRVKDVDSVFNITGFDSYPNQPATPARTRVVVRDSTVVADRALAKPGRGKGRGILALLTDGVALFEAINVVSITNGNQLVLVGDSDRVGTVRLKDGYAVPGTYGVQVPGGNNGANWASAIDVLEVTGNTFTSLDGTGRSPGSVFRANFSKNTFVDRSSFDALIAPRLR